MATPRSRVTLRSGSRHCVRGRRRRHRSALRVGQRPAYQLLRGLVQGGSSAAWSARRRILPGQDRASARRLTAAPVVTQGSTGALHSHPCACPRQRCRPIHGSSGHLFAGDVPKSGVRMGSPLKAGDRRGHCRNTTATCTRCSLIRLPCSHEERRPFRANPQQSARPSLALLSIRHCPLTRSGKDRNPAGRLTPPSRLAIWSALSLGPAIV